VAPEAAGCPDGSVPVQTTGTVSGWCPCSSTTIGLLIVPSVRSAQWSATRTPEVITNGASDRVNVTLGERPASSLSQAR